MYRLRHLTAIPNYGARRQLPSCSSFTTLIQPTNIFRETVEGVRVALGAHNSDTSPDPVPVSEFILHHQYHNRTQTNDIALVKLEHPTTLEATVNLLCLPTTKEFSKPEDLALVTGWGWQRFNRKICLKLKLCNSGHRFRFQISPEKIRFKYPVLP